MLFGKGLALLQLGRAQQLSLTLPTLCFFLMPPLSFSPETGFARQLQSAGWRQVPFASIPSFFLLGWAVRGVQWFVFTVPAPEEVVGFDNFRLSEGVCCGNQGGAGSGQWEKVRAGVCTPIDNSRSPDKMRDPYSPSSRFANPTDHSFCDGSWHKGQTSSTEHGQG